MKKLLIEMVKVLYTITLLLSVIGFIAFLMVSNTAAQNGHGGFSYFSITNLAVFALVTSILISRILADKSPKWLWLGAPALLVIYGFILSGVLLGNYYATTI